MTSIDDRLIEIIQAIDELRRAIEWLMSEVL